MRAATLALLVAASCASSQPPPPATPPTQAPRAERHPPLRLLGEAPTAPPGIGAPGSVVEAVYEVCLDETGHVSRVMPSPGLAAADESIAAALRKWSWFTSGKSCWHQRVLLPVPTPGRIVRQASAGVVGHATRGPEPLLPPWLPALYPGTVVESVYKVCVDDTAIVKSVRPLVATPGADEALIAALQASSWEVVVGSLAQPPYCFASHTRLDFTKSVPLDVAPPSAPFPTTATVAREPGVSVGPIGTLVNKPLPHLSDHLKIALSRGAHDTTLVVVYDVCFGPDGNVAELRPLKPVPGDEPAFLETLRSWRSSPGLAFCMPVRLEFAIHHF
jgi:hypothetical protein